jgi:flagellar hook-associated protein 2
METSEELRMSLGNSAGISFAGLGSGIDTENIVNRLIQLQRQQGTRIERRKLGVSQRKDLYTQFRGTLSNFRSAASALNSGTSFNSVSATSSVTDVATLSGSDAASPGVYALKTFQLAQAQKVGSSAQQDTTSALGLAGSFKVNGTEITVASTENLLQVAEKINNAKAGVTASVINGGTGKAYLNISSDKSGVMNNVRLEEVSGGVLGSLGFTSTAVRSAVTNGMQSFALESSSATLGSQLGFTSGGPKTVTINGQSVEIDASTDTLTSLAAKIDALDEVSAQVVSSQEMGRTVYRLEITGATFTPATTDSGNVLLDLGILKPTNELVRGQDAKYSLDGISLTSDSNSINTAIPGATLTLLQADSTNGKTSNLSISRDSAVIKGKVKAFVEAYNQVADFVAQNSKFDKESFASGPLFGDFTTRQILSELNTTALSNISGLTGNLQNLAQVGITTDGGTKLKIDESVFDKAFLANPTEVSNLFRASGAGSSTALSYVSSTSDTAASGPAGFAINITKAATKQTATASTAMSGNLSAQEILTFTGGALGTTSKALVFSAGTSLTSMVNQINSDSSLKDVVTASIEGGKLKMTAVRFGTPGNFTVTSNLSAATDNSGVGTTGQATVVAGIDVEGTINGEPATGSGQFLTAKTDKTTNATTNGIQIQYTGTAIGAVGNMVFTKGSAALLSSRVDNYLLTTTGLLSAAENSLQAQMDDFDDQIDSLEKSLVVREQQLRAKFLRMEQAISASQAQGQRLTAMMPR